MAEKLKDIADVLMSAYQQDPATNALSDVIMARGGDSPPVPGNPLTWFNRITDVSPAAQAGALGDVFRAGGDIDDPQALANLDHYLQSRSIVEQSGYPGAMVGTLANTYYTLGKGIKQAMGKRAEGESEANLDQWLAGQLGIADELPGLTNAIRSIMESAPSFSDKLINLLSRREKTGPQPSFIRG